MENKRVVNAIRLLIAIVILTVVVFVVDLIVNRDKKITDLIVNRDKKKINDNYNGVYTNKDDLGMNVYAFNGCSFTTINNYILVVDDNYYLYRSSCMGTYLKESGETKSLNIGEYSNSYFITHNDKRFNKDTSVRSIIPNNIIAKAKDPLELNSLSVIAKETEFEGNYFNFERTIKGMNSKILVNFSRLDNGAFKLGFKYKGKVLYEYLVKSFDNMPLFHTMGSQIVMIERDNNINDASKYSYKFRVIGESGLEYDLQTYFPQIINDVTIGYNDSVYVKYDQQSRSYRILIGNDKKFCVENSTSENVAYYEYKITFDYQTNRFKKPEFVGIGREKDGCGYVSSILNGG